MCQSKVALITGAARGIGLAIAQKFLAEGYGVALLDIDAKTLAQTAARLSEHDGVLPIVCDVSDPQQVQTAIEQVAARLAGLMRW